MLFDAELIRFKNMATGAVRIEFDVPELDANRLMQSVTNFLKKPLKIEMTIDGVEVVKSFVEITDLQKAKISILYGEIARKHDICLKETKERLKSKLLGDKDISITGLSKMQASEMIDKLEAIKGE